MSTTTPTPSPEATQSSEATQPETPLAMPTCCGRRTVLRAAGLVALSGGAVALAACSADSSTTTPGAGASSAEPSAAESSAAPSPSGSAASPSEEASSKAPAGTTVAISEVTVGGGLVVDEKYVVTQPTDGQFKAFSAICTHQGCPVGSVEDGVIVCPCHNSHFDITSGDPVSGPAQEPLPSVEFVTSGDSIVITG